ncbi:odorant receptor 13a-like [Vespula squamosa]|uniref:Odorant receptor 13a-like n=2 Tax=Vespula squamosa TaxID=30214 RepID=A0ABD2C8V4_VESSQ
MEIVYFCPNWCTLFFVCILSRKAKFEMIVLTLQSCDELHSCDWYELSTMDMKSIWICTMRCSKPLRLTCAKFCILSVRTFIDGNQYFR